MAEKRKNLSFKTALFKGAYVHNTVLTSGLMTVPTKSRIVINGLDVTWIYLENTNIIFRVVDSFYKLDSTGYVETYDYVVPLNV